MSLTLPFRQAHYPSEIIAPWLASLLAEEEQLFILTRSLGLDRSDTLAVLKEIGGDTAGAFSFEAKSDLAARRYTPLTEFYGIKEAGLALERHFGDLQKRPFLVGEEGVRTSFAGAQTMTALAVLNAAGDPVLRLPVEGDLLAIARGGAPSTVILKPDNPVLPGITENKTCCLHLARSTGILSAEATILSAGRRQAICVLRHDRRISRTSALQRIHQEDFAQANGIAPGRKYERGTVKGPDLATLLATGRQFPPAGALALLDQAVFNILIANTDAHAKNYSLLLPVGGGPRLAPLYDVSTVLPWPHVAQYLAQNIAGKKRQPADLEARHWDAVAGSVNYRPADVHRRVHELVDRFVARRVAVTKAVKALPGTSPGHVEEAAGMIEKNALQIAARLRQA